MKCPRCGSGNTLVVDSRNKEDDTQRHRRHKCNNCGYRFTTCEIYKEKYDELTDDYINNTDRVRRLLKLIYEVIE